MGEFSFATSRAASASATAMALLLSISVCCLSATMAVAVAVAQSDSESPTQQSIQWMNVGGPEYASSNAPGFDTEWILKDPTVRFFDAYSRPIKTLYSQVHWTNHGQIPLPKDVVERYNSIDSNCTTTDTMAVVGYEVDQVRIDPSTGEEVSVPITWAYNHHYMVYLMGRNAAGEATTLMERPVTQRMRTLGMVHGGSDNDKDNDTTWLPGIPNTNLTDDHDENTAAAALTEDDRSWLFLSEGNGGEMRKSYHSYPRGYAQLVRRPHSFSVTPMQIDTWNRDTMSNTSRFVPPNGNPNDYFPNSSSRRIVDDLARANYNPLLECPCTDRLPKTWTMTYKLEDANTNHGGNGDDDETIDNDDSSQLRLDNSTECFDAADRLLPSTHATQTMLPGEGTGTCHAVVRADGSLEVTWDETTTTTTTTKMDGSAATVASKNHALVGTTPSGSIVNATVVLNTTSRMATIALKGPYLERKKSSNNNNTAVDDDHDDGDVWFAIGLGADSMCIRMEADECTKGGPYAIVVLPPNDNNSNNTTNNTTSSTTTSTVVERKLDYHGAGRILLPPDNTNGIEGSDGYSLTVLSNEIEFDEDVQRRRRVVRLLRPLQGPTDAHYSFREDELHKKSLKIILAKGCSRSTHFGKHCGHQSPLNGVSFARVDALQEIVRDGLEGRLGTKPFRKNCLDEPYGDLVKQNNPTCRLETYRGGLSCCVHDQFLLDAHQTVPWRDQLLEYRLKYRFYYQDYVPAKPAEPTATAMRTTTGSTPSHRDLERFYWVTEAGAGEYDVPECQTPETQESCVHTITSRWKVSDFAGSDDPTITGIELIYAGPHCHAPVCKSLELYDDDTGRLLCSVEPLRGKGRRNSAVSTNHNNNGTISFGAFATEEKYDEEGFIAIPPCLWSHNGHRGNGDDDGLPPPTFLSFNTTLLSIKRANNTYSHTGEMASWQMRGVYSRGPESSNDQQQDTPLAVTEATAEAATHRRLRKRQNENGVP